MTQKKELVAVVLAGGVGKRFWPLSEHKTLFRFLGKPYVDYTVSSILPKEVTRVVVIANPENKDALDQVQFPVPVTTVVQQRPSGMADALLAAKSQIAGARLLIFISDGLFDSDLLRTVLKTANTSKAFGVLPGWKVSQYFPGGYLKVKDTRIHGIVEKPEEGKEPSAYVNISGHYIDDSNVLLEQLSKTKSDNDDVYEQALSKLMKHDDFVLVPYEGHFHALKYPWHVLDVMDQLLHDRVKSYRGKHIDIRSNVVIEGDVHIGNNVKIFENTKILGPTYIGDNTIIGNNNIVRESHIGEHCVTGFNTDITRSYIGDNCWFHSNYIGDSILEGNISMGAGSVLANLRLDESDIHSTVREQRVSAQRSKLGVIIGNHVRIGVNASIMPGVKIGADSFVGAGCVLAKDVPDNTYAETSGRTVLKRNTKSVASVSRSQFRKKLSE